MLSPRSTIHSKLALGGSLVLLFSFAACGQKNSSSDNSVPVVLQSAAYKPSGATPLVRSYLAPASALNGLFHTSESVVTVDPVTTVSDLRICAKSIQFDHRAVTFKPVLVNLTDGSVTRWGQLLIPKGQKPIEIEMVAAEDAACGVDYSVSFNGITSTAPIEFKWKLDSLAEIEAGNTLTVSVSTAVIALRQAGDASTLSEMKTHIEAIQDGARRN
ncbi:MAG: hypothetical protein H7222_01105 [Methylotenera sp.]|nr:hypothetical protein [Oligoflexia bacterium]